LVEALPIIREVTSKYKIYTQKISGQIEIVPDLAEVPHSQQPDFIGLNKEHENVENRIYDPQWSKGWEDDAG